MILTWNYLAPMWEIDCKGEGVRRESTQETPFVLG
jgi:hypothetical protein